MKSALIISLFLHISIYFITSELVRFRSVRYIPRQIYSVSLLSMEEARSLMDRKEEVKEKPVSLPPRKPQPQQPKEEVNVPKEKPKVKKKKKKTVPSSEIKRQLQDKETKGGSQSQSEPGKPATGDMSLDTSDFPFGYYLVSVRRKIASNWDVPVAGSAEELYCKVYFRISRDGSIVEPAIESSSGSFLFDQAALRAVLHSSPLPPLPGEFPDDYLGVHFNFAYEEK